MNESEHLEHVILGGGEAGKYMAGDLAARGDRTAVVEREQIGGSCPTITCHPSKHVLHNAKVTSVVRHAAAWMNAAI